MTTQPWNVKGWEASNLGDILFMTARWDQWNSFWAKYSQRGQQLYLWQIHYHNGRIPPFRGSKEVKKEWQTEIQRPRSVLWGSKACKKQISCELYRISRWNWDRYAQAFLKSRTWVGTQCQLWPFATPPSKTHLLMGLRLFKTRNNVPELSEACISKSSVRTELKHVILDTYVHPLNIIFFTRAVKSNSSLHGKYLQVDILCSPTTCTLRVNTHTRA